MLNLWLHTFDTPKSLHIVRRFPATCRSEIHAEQRQTTKESDEQARQFQVQARPSRRRKSLGPSQEPGQQALLWPRPARPAPRQEAERLWHPAAGQAEAQG